MILRRSDFRKKIAVVYREDANVESGGVIISYIANR